MTRNLLPKSGSHGVRRTLQCARTPRLSKKHLRPMSSIRSDNQEEDVDAFNAALDAALQDYDESDPFRGFNKPGTGAKPNNDLVKEKTHHERVDENERSLPLPPFLRRKALDDKRSLRPNIRKHEESLREFEVPNERLYTRAGHKSIAKNKRVAPFSTRFAQNPWARALGTPVRECRMTGLRLPTSCLIDFHAVEKQSEEEIGDEPSKNPTVQLMPMSLAADLIPSSSRYRGYSEEEQALQRLSRQATLRRRPHGVASYLAAHHSVLDSITKLAPENPVKKYNYTRRYAGSRLLSNILTVKYGEGARLHWREDMADFVLGGLRAVVIKRLRYWIYRKGKKDAEGAITEIIGGGMSPEPDLHGGLRGWRGVEMVDDALCVLRLRPEVDAEDEYQENEESKLDHSIGSANYTEASSTNNISGSSSTSASSRLHQVDHATQTPEPSPRERYASDATETPSANTGLGNATPSQLEESHSTSSQTEPSIYKQTDSPTYIEPDSAFTSPTRTPSFLLGLMPLPPDRRPSNLYCPTVPYRGRRIPIFDLYLMLGPDVIEDLLKDSVFAQSRYVAMTSSLGTFNVIGSMSKLMGYVSSSKRDFFERIESESRGFTSKTTKASP